MGPVLSLAPEYGTPPEYGTSFPIFLSVIPADAGIQGRGEAPQTDSPGPTHLDSRFRGNDGGGAASDGKEDRE